MSNTGTSSCRLCGNSAVRKLSFDSEQSFGSFAISHCPVCDHRFIQNPPDMSKLGCFYDDRYKQIDGKNPVRPAFRDLALSRALRSCLPKNSRVLDIGCNYGRTLMSLPRSFELHGVEFSSSAADIASSNPGLRIHRGTFENIDLGGLRFDCVIALAVIEHVVDPIAFLKKINGVLAESGILVLMTGDPDSWHSRKLGKKWHLYHCDGHLHFFSRISMDHAMKKAGLTPYKWLWAGPSPLSSKFPGPARRFLHSATACLMFPWLYKERHGDIMYVWAKKQR